MKPWFKDCLTQIETAIKLNKIPHALIISGNAGIGKLEFAQILVEKLTNINVKDDNLSYSENNKEILIRNSNYNSLIYCQPEARKNLTKISQTISVNQIRKFCDFLTKTNSKTQIGIIKYADQMHNSAANALLKTLEEPRKNTIIILLVNNIEKIPTTILSRCQKINLTADKNSINWIKENIEHTVDEKLINKLLIESNFSPKLVVEKINTDKYKQELKWHNQLLTMAINPNNINNIENTNNNEFAIMQCLQNLLIQAIHLKTNKKVTTDESYNHILKKTNNKFFFNLLADVNQAISFSQTTVNKKILLDNILIVWSHITHLQKYPQILRNH